MTRELIKRKYPLGTRIKFVRTDLFGTKMSFKGTVVDHTDRTIEVHLDDGTKTFFLPGYDHFSTIYHEEET